MMFRNNKEIEKAVKNYMKNDSEIKEAAELLYYKVIRKYLKEKYKDETF
ncbi:MAG: hypothetical protein M1465_02215 [Candidatus Marsarchaeota archaeon]|jgi:hypothetical protein|nr:hypothetical protein [Candidatus Marsarchaeota archaeon]